jgi:hypothetical protein
LKSLSVDISSLEWLQVHPNEKSRLRELTVTGEQQIPEAALNARKHTSVVSAVRWWVVLQFVALLITAPGCDFGGGAPPPDGQLAIERVAKWYQYYRAENRGKPPPDEDAFIAFIEAKLQARGDTVDPDQLLTSPRDGQRYVVQYGTQNSTNMERNVAVYEKEGYRGKKLVAFESVWNKEVDDAELQSILAGK